MTWTDWYLICFVVGFMLSVLSLLGGVHIHLPHFHVHFGGFGHHGIPHAGHGPAGPVAYFNFGTVAAFLLWFGATGYLLQRYSSIWTLLAFGVALLAGVVGAALVFLFRAKFLIRPGEELDPADYQMQGVLGTVSSRIRPDGMGEILFSQAGARRAAGARSESGEAIPAGVEVVVTKYENGIAWVRRWDDLAGTSQAGAGAN
ncbi:MAG: NfeD family protein [Acidobacteria bacterium]|nr:NfeD family protein [Acidobacteriota bacterium]